MSWHPETEDLLRFADGESPAGAAARIRSHLEACWQCRSEMDELQKTISECVRYRKQGLETHLPSPPSPWTDIYRRFAEIDAELDRSTFRERFARALRPNLWVPIAVALLLTSIVWLRFRQTPSVQAADLLRNAIASADARPGKPRRIQIRTRNRRITRVVGEQRVSDGALEALFAAAHYDWADPLSAKSYQAWRHQLTDKKEQVFEEPGGYRIEISTGSGELKGATLKIRSSDLAPVEERLEFRNEEWVEITQIADEPPVTIASAASKRTVTQEGAKSVVVNASIGAELRVLAALHEVGADLGDPVEVSRSGGAIMVAGMGVAPHRQQQIKDALRSQPNVMVRFSDPAPEKVAPESETPAEKPIRPEIQQFQTRLAEQLGGRAMFTQLAAQALDLSEPIMARVYALRRLAERVPAGAEPELTSEDWRALSGLQRDHIEALQRQTEELERLLKPALGAVRRLDTAPGDAAWQPATEELFQSARQVDKFLAVMFGAAAGDGASDRLPSQLLSSLGQFRGRLEAYDRLIERRSK